MKNQCSLLINFSKLYEMNSKITPGLTNNQSQPFFAIGIIPLPKVLFLNCLRHHLCFLKCIILGITVYYNINLKKLCLFSNLGKEIKKNWNYINTDFPSRLDSDFQFNFRQIRKKIYLSNLFSVTTNYIIHS